MMNQKVQKYGIWWLIFLILTIILFSVTSQNITSTGFLSRMAGHLIFAFLFLL